MQKAPKLLFHNTNFLKVDLANHDSCGGPLCGDPPQIDNDLNVDSNEKLKNKDLKYYNYTEDELKYYIA